MNAETPAAAPSKDLADILNGLGRAQKTLSPKFFYDQAGSELFDAITELPEYYPTRTELGILKDNMPEIVRQIGPRASLIEFGAGNSMKTRVLLQNLEDLAVYVPVDISDTFLYESAENLREEFPDLEVLPVAADFTREFDLPSPSIMPERNIVFFPGSTIGNFRPEEALDLLKVMRAEAKDGGGLLIGVDLKKEPAVLERAYNDSAGVTAAFNLNMLTHLNREFGSNFDTEHFSHRAIYNEALGRIEMHLVSERNQTVTVGGETFEFPQGDYILSECSHKYSVEEFGNLAMRAGFTVDHVWTDPKNYFSMQYLETHSVFG